MRTQLRFLSLLSLVAAPAAAQQEVLLVGDSSNDRIMVYDAFDGSLINEDLIVDMFGMPYNFITPKEAIQVNNELWVVDQVEDTVFRFDHAGNYLSSITTGLDNLRGGQLINGTVHITNRNTGNGAPGPAVIQFDTNGMSTGSFLTTGTSPFDLVEFNSELIVSDFDADSIDRYDAAGTFLGSLAIQGAGTALNNPESLAISLNNTVLVAGFGTPSGVYEFDATGAELSFVATTFSPRAVDQLGNGNLIISGTTGIIIWDPVAMTFTDVSPATGANGQNISHAVLMDGIGTSYCGPAVLNSTGSGAVIGANGSSTAADNNVTLSASALPTGSFGFFLTSQMQGLVMQPGGSQGILCLGGAIGRYVGPGQVQNSGNLGEISLGLDLTNTPTPTGPVSIQAGETWYFTAWYRDAVGGVATSNFADGLEITFL